MSKKNKDQTGNPPVWRLFRLNELPGWFAKRILVPPGRLGVAVHPNGEVRTFTPGKHRLLSVLERLQGKGAGLRLGYLTPGGYTARLKLENLLSGDNELLDGTLICPIEIRDAGQFFKAVIIPQGGIGTTGLDLDPALLQQALGSITSRYAAADLVGGLLDTRLTGQIQSSLDAILGSQGMAIKGISLFTLSRAEKRALIAEKAQALAERLQQVELQAGMAKIETQAQLKEFLQQVDPDLDEATHLCLTGGDKEKVSGSLKGKLADTLRNWLTVESSQEGGKRRWRIEALFRHKNETQAQVKPPRPPRLWWLPRTLWMAGVVITGGLLTMLVNTIARAASWDNRLEVHLVIWAFVIGVVLESLKKLYEKNEAYSDEAWALPGFQHLDNLVGNDRPWADELVRGQSAGELLHMKEVFTEIRSREYKRERTELALKIRNEIERNIQDCIEKIQRPDFGRPPYVTDLHVTRHAWEHMLDRDENLLLQANLLSGRVHLLQQKSHEGGLTDEMLTGMNASISEFCNQFFERGRPLQIPPQKPAK